MSTLGIIAAIVCPLAIMWVAREAYRCGLLHGYGAAKWPHDKQFAGAAAVIDKRLRK